MIKISNELMDLLEIELSLKIQDVLELGPNFKSLLSLHESNFLHKSYNDCYSSIYPDFFNGRAIVFTTTMTDNPREVLTVACLANLSEDWKK